MTQRHHALRAYSGWMLLLAFTFYAASSLAASSKTAAKPSPRPAAKKVKRAAPKVVYKKPNTLIRPKDRSKEASHFEVIRNPGKSNELEIRYTSSDPALTLNSNESIVIQLNAPPSLVIEPSVITSSEWPKGATKMALKYKGALSAGTWIDGSAAYTVCKAKKCRETQSPIRADFR